MLHIAAPPLLYVTCPQTREHYARAALIAAGAKEIVAEDAPVWKIEDREEYGYIRNNPQMLRVGSVMDPWSWYAAVWSNAHRSGGRALRALHAWSPRGTDFKSFVYGATHPERLTEIPQPLGILWEPDDLGGWKGLLASDLGLCSFTYLYHYGTKRDWQEPDRRPEFDVDVLLDGHRIQAALTDMLATVPGLRLPPAPRFDDRAKAALAASYDADMVKWAAVADGPVCRSMGYETPFSPGRRHHTLPARAMGSTRKGPGRRLTTGERWGIDQARWRRRQRLLASR